MSAPSKTSAAARLRGDAERAAGALPPLLVAAERLAATVLMGAHGRRRAGPGETFWQYRRAAPGDAASAIDWRRSARGDALFVRETEWEQPQTVQLWCDKSRAMSYRSAATLPSKGERAALLCAALAVLLTRGGERISAPAPDQGVSPDGSDRPRAGKAQLNRVVAALAREDASDYGTPPVLAEFRGGRALLVSDFFGQERAAHETIAQAGGAGVSGVALQIVDPAEESFPFDGRVIFESMTGAIKYDAERAQSLKDAYVAELEARRERLRAAARRSGWIVLVHRTDAGAPAALLRLAQLFGAGASGAFG